MERVSKQTSSRIMKQHSSRASSRAGSSLASSSHSKFNPLPSRGSISFLGSKSNFSSSRKNLASDSMRFQKPAAVVYDEYGMDVTPQSLLQSDSSVRKNQSNMFGAEAGTPNESTFQQSIYGTGFTSASFVQPFSSSMFGSSAIETGTISAQGSMSEELTVARPTVREKETPTPVETVDRDEDKLTKEDMEKEVIITLTETETIWMLDIPGTCVALDSEEAEEVKEKNEKYQELCKGRRGNDRYSDRGMQTINDAPKFKQTQTDDVVKTDRGMNASLWDMHDTYQALKEAEDRDADKEEETLEELSSRATSRMTSRATSRMTSGTPWRSRAPTAMGMSTIPEEGSVATGSSIFTASMFTDVSVHSEQSSAVVRREKEKIDPTQPNNHPILKLESLKDSLCIAERVVTQNIFQPKQALYRNLPPLIDPDHPLTTLDSLNLQVPHLEKLWTYSCPLTKKHSITCLAWNPTNKDILAVGYGAFNTEEQIGIICCWSLKNPQHPERIFHAPCSVTSLGFSHLHPNLLAAGLYNGSVALYNARSTSHQSVLDSRDAPHRHSAPVWQVSWVLKERSMGDDKAEVLVSISVDGHIVQWTLRKGFESTQLMKLKRMVTPKPQEKKTTKSKHTRGHVTRVNPASLGQGEAYISQHAPGMGFDFWPWESNIYLACTEEGFIHKCSCSYNEQVLETYTGHTGPIYRVRWSPFMADLFLSCSADWTVRLWHQDHSTPLYSFHAAQKSIYDVCWSPFDSTLFGCVSEGRVEIWNLGHSVLDPLLVYKPLSEAKQTCITFAHDTKVVLVGDSEGEVTVYLLKNIPPSPLNQHPERTFHAPCSVTSLGFSHLHPNLLAAGLYNGSVALYNARSTSHESVLDSRDAPHRHSAPVWQVSWVLKERSMGDDKAEVLVSISVDGHIVQWTLRKGFESTQLMKLKRMVTPKPQEKKTTKSKHTRGHVTRVNPASLGQGEAYISQHAPGMGFDFWPRESNIYLACTEEGFIHKCSCSYNEQVLETYTGHTGPIYRVRWSPFMADLFLSCSADWTVRLWHQDHSTPLYSFHAAQKSIYDVCWSPFDSTLFGCVSEGRVEIWNLGHSVLDPLLVYKPLSEAKQTCITFAHDTKVVLVGDSEGEVAVYLLKNIPPSPQNQTDALLNVVNSSPIMDTSF